MRHPHAYTLELLTLAVAKLPPGFPERERKRFQKALATFEKAGESAKHEDIRQAIVEIGFASWPHRRAYQDLYDRYARSSEESHLLENLDQAIREKYERFIHEGGKISHVEQIRSIDDLRAPSPFERYFDPEEKFAITQALLTARDAARAEIDDLVTGPKAKEYEALISEYRDEQKKMRSRIQELAALADISPRWQQEIAARVQAIEEGWSILGQGYTLQALDQELEYWQGTLSSFLHA